jgi:predicted dienelactone hydrolase
VRSLFFVLAFLLVAPLSVAMAETAPFRAGIVRLTVSAKTPFDVLVWYPTEEVEEPWQIGPFPIQASHGATPESGRFPIVLLSHGGGLTGGSPLLLRELSASLARQGFVVVAPFHGKTGVSGRTHQIILGLDAVLAEPRIGPHADPKRIGMLGFSLGGAVTLELAGAVPNEEHFARYCAAHSDDVMSCGHAPDGGDRSAHGERPAAGKAPVLALKAIVLLDPLAVLFERNGLAAVTMPVLLFRPERSQLPGEANALGLAASLPGSPEIHLVPGRHFVFTDVCAPARQSAAPELCEDTAGVDRVAVHRDVEVRIGTFLHDRL